MTWPHIPVAIPGTTSGEEKIAGGKRKTPPGISIAPSVTNVAAMSAAAETLPKRMDTHTTKTVMIKQHKRTTKEVNRDNFNENATKRYQEVKYKKIFKVASLEVEANVKDSRKRGRKGFGTMP